MPTKKHYLYQISCIVMMFCVINLAQAKTVYINDQLRVGIRPDPNNDSAPLAVVSTGDKLELLDSDSGYALVKTKDGVEGWVKEIYTTTNVPAIVQLKDLSQSAGGTSKKIQELTKQVGLMESANQVLNENLEKIRAEKNRIEVQLLAARSGQPTGNWVYWLAALFGFAIVSFIFGMFWYRSQAMKRLGGLRIYF